MSETCLTHAKHIYFRIRIIERKKIILNINITIKINLNLKRINSKNRKLRRSRFSNSNFLGCSPTQISSSSKMPISESEQRDFIASGRQVLCLNWNFFLFFWLAFFVFCWDPRDQIQITAKEEQGRRIAGGVMATMGLLGAGMKIRFINKPIFVFWCFLCALNALRRLIRFDLLVTAAFFFSKKKKKKSYWI